MFEQLPTLQKLTRQLQKIPYLASRNIYRVASHFLMADQQSIDAFIQVIMEAREKINLCQQCFNWTEQGTLCPICSSDRRDKSIICVVETWHDLYAMEKAGEYKGVYHILGGSLCPLEGIGPDDLRIPELIKRIDESVSELILATNQTPEGEATASLIVTRISKLPANVSRLASGVPTGSTLEYMDRITISKALVGRRPF